MDLIIQLFNIDPQDQQTPEQPNHGDKGGQPYRYHSKHDDIIKVEKAGSPFTLQVDIRRNKILGDITNGEDTTDQNPYVKTIFVACGQKRRDQVLFYGYKHGGHGEYSDDGSARGVGNDPPDHEAI